MTPYKEKIVLTYQTILRSQTRLLDRIVNVAMTGEFAEINKTFKEGDTFEFNLDMFRDSKDQNLQILVKLYDELEDALDSLINLNNITDEELEELEDYDDEEEFEYEDDEEEDGEDDIL